MHAFDAANQTTAWILAVPPRGQGTVSRPNVGKVIRNLSLMVRARKAAPGGNRREEEESWKPIMEAYYRKAWEEREKTIAVLTRSTRAWQISVQGVIFRRWAEALVKVRDSREKMVQFLHRIEGECERKPSRHGGL